MFTPKRITEGFEPAYHKMGFSPNPVPYELTPNTAFPKGSMVVLTNNKVALAAAASVTGILGVMAEDIEQADNPSDKITKGLVYDNPDMVYTVSIKDMENRDYTATGGASNGTTVTASESSITTANSFRGALLYVYEGTNKGAIRTVSAYANAANVGTWTVTCPFAKACDTTTKFIVFGGGAAADDVINVGQRGIVLKDHLTVDGDASTISSGNPVGPLVCVGLDPEALTMDVMIRRSCHAFS